MNPQGAEMSDTITIRHTTEADREALRRLGDLDGGRAPAGPALAAYENGELVGAVDVGPEPANDAAGLKLPNALEAGGRRHADLLGEGLVGLASIVLELPQERPRHRI